MTAYIYAVLTKRGERGKNLKIAHIRGAIVGLVQAIEGSNNVSAKGKVNSVYYKKKKYKR